jgi:hypothetical protein
LKLHSGVGNRACENLLIEYTTVIMASNQRKPESNVSSGEDAPPKRIWQIEITTLDLHDEPFLAIVVDRSSRLLVASAALIVSDDIRTILEKASGDLGYPDEVWIDQGFRFSSAAVEEWGMQHSIAVVWTRSGK